MAEENVINRIQKELDAIPELNKTEREVLTSDALIGKILPIMAAYVKTNVKANQETKDKTSETLRGFVEKTLDFPSEVGDVGGFVKDLGNGIWDGTLVEQTINTLRDHWLFGPILNVVIVILQIMAFGGAYMSAASEKAKQTANEDIQPFLLDIGTLTELYYRYPDGYRFVLNEMLKMGINEKKAEVFLDTKLQLLPTEILGFLYNREIIDEVELNERLTKLKVNPDDFEHVKETFKQYPNAQDIIRFAVREVFSEELAGQLGLFGDMPESFIEEGRKLGMPEQVLKWYWGAHWTPPSYTNAREMLFRQVIDEEEFDNIVRVNDYMPNYREKLRKISYNAITRVDIRRLYRDQVIDFEEMVTRYRDTGYNPDDALLLAEWTDREYGEENKERSKADILGMYKAGYKNPGESVALLREVGYPEEIAKDFILRIDLERKEKKKQSKLKLWKKGYLNDYYTENEVSSYMSGYGMSGEEIKDIIEDWNIDKSAKLKLLTPAQLKEIYIYKKISKEDLLLRLTSLGYTDDDAALLEKAWMATDE